MSIVNITTEFQLTSVDIDGQPDNRYGIMIGNEIIGADGKSRYGGVTGIRIYCKEDMAKYAIREEEIGMIVIAVMDTRGEIIRVYSKEPRI